MPAPRINLRYIARLAGAALGFALALLLAVAVTTARAYTHAVLHPGCIGDRASLAESGYPAEAVAFPSHSGPTLRGWFTPGSAHPEIVVVVVPGHGGNSSAALPDAQVLADAGISTLVYEHRSCADPALAASTGPDEAQDLLGAVDFISALPGVQHIGVMGFSEGGTAALLAAEQDHRIKAVVAMGGYDSLRSDVLDADSPQPLYVRVERRLVLWMLPLEGVRVRDASPVDHIAQISPRPLLLIYGEYERANGDALFAAARDPKDLWIVPGTGHGGYQHAAPDEYSRRVVTFFADAFGVPMR